MKKLLCVILPAALLLFSSCSISTADPNISEPAAAKYIDKETSKPLKVQTSFKQSDPVIYFTVKIKNFPKDSKLKAVWKYLGNGTETSSEMVTSGTGYEAFSLNKNSGPFPSGKYEVTVSADINGKKLEAKGNFEIDAENTPTHISNPVTSKSIDNEQNLSPQNITSRFSRADSIIYFIIQGKDLPANSKVTCEWLYKDTGDIETTELVTEGSRNIAFHLKPDLGQKFPAGSYTVTASVTVDNKIESLSSDFEID